LGFVTKCLLRLNGWNNMGLVTHEWLVAYVLPDYDIIAKPKMCCECKLHVFHKYCNENVLTT